MNWSNTTGGTWWIARQVTALLVVGLVAGSVFFPAKTARADPHAIFYTAIGQQQLFFNVLAALDQADYVETQDERDNLAEQRAEVDVEPPFLVGEDDLHPLLRATLVGAPDPGGVTSASDPPTPGVSNLLTRSLTLEGTDLYTDFLVRMLGAETGRRNALNELVQQYCDHALGLKDCDPDSKAFDGDGNAPAADAEEKKENYRQRAYITDPLKWAAEPIELGVLPALSSGTITDNQKRLDRYIDDENLDKRPYAYSPDIDHWRQRASNNTTTELLDDLLIKVGSDFIPSGYLYPFEEFTIDNDGSIELKSDDFSMDRMRGALDSVLFAPFESYMLASAAADRVALQQTITSNQGSKADVILKAQFEDDGDGDGGAVEGVVSAAQAQSTSGQNLGELALIVKNPAASRSAEIFGISGGLGLLDASQGIGSQFTERKPGDFDLVLRQPGGDGGGGGGGVQGAAAVQGLQSAGQGEGREGQVAGFLEIFEDVANFFFGQSEYDEEKKPTSPAANFVAGHGEEGALRAFKALSNFESREDDCGFVCGNPNVGGNGDN